MVRYRWVGWSCLLWIGFGQAAAQTADEILEAVDGYRRVAESFAMTIRMSDYEFAALKEQAEFVGFFSGTEKSVVGCIRGKNKGMNVLMKGDKMWVSLPRSRRALRITPMQRLMGQAANGDVAKVAYSADYSGEIVTRRADEIRLRLRASRPGATYQQVMLFVDPSDYRVRKAEFFLLSGKHLKTAYYLDMMVVDGRRVVRRIKIVDHGKEGAYTTMEYGDVRPVPVPEKYFNVMYLPKLELAWQSADQEAP